MTIRERVQKITDAVARTRPAGWNKIPDEHKPGAALDAALTLVRQLEGTIEFPDRMKEDGTAEV